MSKIKYKYFHYAYSDGTIIRVRAKRKPSSSTMPRSGSWVVKERHGNKWEMPCFPEIGIHMLNKMEYLGYVFVEVNNE